MRSNLNMSHPELGKTFYYRENGEFSPDGVNVMGLEGGLTSISTEQTHRGADCRFQTLTNNMACHGSPKRKENFCVVPYTKTNASRQQRHGRRNVGSRPVYRHIPHRDKPPHLVARRNARERRRVQAVNNAFCRLRRHVPYENKQKRLSKVKTLRFAIDYINKLKTMVEEHDSRLRTHQTNGIHEGNLPKKGRWTNDRFFTVRIPTYWYDQ